MRASAPGLDQLVEAIRHPARAYDRSVALLDDRHCVGTYQTPLFWIQSSQRLSGRRSRLRMSATLPPIQVHFRLLEHGCCRHSRGIPAPDRNVHRHGLALRRRQLPFVR